MQKYKLSQGKIHHIFSLKCSLDAPILKLILICVIFSFLKTWMYIAVPVLLYTGERIFRAIRSCLYEVNVLKVFPFFFPI